MTSIIAVLASTLIIQAPAAPAANPAPRAARVDSSAMTFVSVSNTRKVPVTVVVEQGDRDVKIGVVAPLADSTLRVPDSLVGTGEVRIFVEPRGQLETASDPIDLKHGQHLDVEMPVL